MLQINLNAFIILCELDINDVDHNIFIIKVKLESMETIIPIIITYI